MYIVCEILYAKCFYIQFSIGNYTVRTDGILVDIEG